MAVSLEERDLTMLSKTLLKLRKLLLHYTMSQNFIFIFSKKVKLIYSGVLMRELLPLHSMLDKAFLLINLNSH